MKKKSNGKWNQYLIAGLIMTGLAVLLGIIGFFWTPYSTTAMSATEKFMAPSWKHWFGTDNFGRDIFSRVMKGMGTTIVSAAFVVLFSGIIGILLGAVTDPVIVTIISWASFGVDTISVIYGIW